MKIDKNTKKTQGAATIKPYRAVINVSKDENQAYWKEIGCAWPHKKGNGFNIELFSIPLDGKFSIFEPKEIEEE